MLFVLHLTTLFNFCTYKIMLDLPKKTPENYSLF